MTDKSYSPPCSNYLQPFYLSMTLYACVQRDEHICKNDSHNNTSVMKNVNIHCIQLPSTKLLSLRLLVFYVTCNNISVIYVTAQMCRRTEEVVVPTVGLPTP